MTSSLPRCRAGRFATGPIVPTTSRTTARCLSYEALLEIIHIHLVDVYAAAKHPTAAKTRLEMWQESAAVFPPMHSGHAR